MTPSVIGVQAGDRLTINGYRGDNIQRQGTVDRATPEFVVLFNGVQQDRPYRTYRLSECGQIVRH